MLFLLCHMLSILTLKCVYKSYRQTGHSDRQCLSAVIDCKITANLPCYYINSIPNLCFIDIMDVIIAVFVMMMMMMIMMPCCYVNRLNLETSKMKIEYLLICMVDMIGG